MRRLIDREPLHADGAAGHALGLLVERTVQRRDHVGAGAPITADGEPNAYRARLYVLRLAGHEPIGENIDREPAGRARRYCDIHGLA